ASSNLSVSSSIFNFRDENGRTYHAYKDGKYNLPNDEEEQDRLDRTFSAHNLFLLTFDNKLGLAPPNHPNSKVKHVLDIGTGTGLWAIEFGEDHPEAERRHKFPINPTDGEYPITRAKCYSECHFEINDLDKEWAYSQPFDYIHTRGKNSCIEDWKLFLKKAFNNLTPGGDFELQELEVHARSDDGTLTPVCPLAKCMAYLQEAFDKLGRSFQEIPQLVAVTQQVGFVDVKLRLFKWPSNSWPKDPKFRELGAWNNENINHGLVAITMAPFTRALGWTKEEVDAFRPSVRRDLNNRSTHAYWPVYSVYGRKPTEERSPKRKRRRIIYLA
ncbi:S-adenosyl-L-methionine-dependent methyltransferase, partial [Colletotrichum cereale]